MSFFIFFIGGCGQWDLFPSVWNDGWRSIFGII
jgi:hypothetical protein